MHRLALEAATNTSGSSKLIGRLKFRLTVRANAPRAIVWQLVFGVSMSASGTRGQASNPKSEYVAVISTVVDGLRLACWFSFSTHRGKMSFRYVHSLVFTEVVENKQTDRRG